MGKNFSTIVIIVCIVVSATLLTLTYLTKQGKITNPITQIQNSIAKTEESTFGFCLERFTL